MDRVEAALERLAELQRQNEERFGRVEASLARLAEAQQHTEQALQRQGAQIEALTEAQRRTESAVYRVGEALRELADWQRGEVGRRDSERYEREMVRAAPSLFNGGEGGTADQPWVQQRLSALLRSLFGEQMFEREADPFLADLIWWKGEQILVAEISLEVNGYDVFRASRRAETLRRSGAQALAAVIGKDWASLEAQVEARTRDVEWKVGQDLSDGFMAFRRGAPTGK